MKGRKAIGGAQRDSDNATQLHANLVHTPAPHLCLQQLLLQGDFTLQNIACRYTRLVVGSLV